MSFYINHPNAKRGQGATEYLVLLAVVLIIALVAMGLLSFFPGLAADTRMTQSQAYWKSEASPFSVQDHAMVGSTGNLSLVVQNMDSTGTFTMKNISIASSTGSVYNDTAITFGAGEVKTITLSAPGLIGAAGSTYELSMNITYVTPNGLAKVQYGTKPLIGKYT